MRAAWWRPQVGPGAAVGDHGRGSRGWGTAEDGPGWLAVAVRHALAGMAGFMAGMAW